MTLGLLFVAIAGLVYLYLEVRALKREFAEPKPVVALPAVKEVLEESDEDAKED